MSEYLPWVPLAIAVGLILYVAIMSDKVADALEKTYEDDQNDRD